MGENKIPIPNLFYKIILRHEAQAYKAISFLMPNSTSALNELTNYVCTIDSLEKLTSLDFFSDLPDNLEIQFETKIDLKDWNFSYHQHHSAPKTDTIIKSATIAVQCLAKTKRGTRCKNTTTSANRLCNQHQK